MVALQGVTLRPLLKAAWACQSFSQQEGSVLSQEFDLGEPYWPAQGSWPGGRYRSCPQLLVPASSAVTSEAGDRHSHGCLEAPGIHKGARAAVEPAGAHTGSAGSPLLCSNPAGQSPPAAVPCPPLPGTCWEMLATWLAGTRKAALLRPLSIVSPTHCMALPSSCPCLQLTVHAGQGQHRCLTPPWGSGTGYTRCLEPSLQALPPLPVVGSQVTSVTLPLGYSV